MRFVPSVRGAMMALAVFALLPFPAAAQVRASTPAPCAAPVLVGDLGISGTYCTRCSMTGRHVPGLADIEFGTEPMVTAIRKDGPADGKLEEQDVIVAVNGRLITTPAGAVLYSWLPPSTPVLVTVRRAGQLKDIDVTTAARCKPITPQLSQWTVADSFASGAWSTNTMPPGRGWFGIGISCGSCGLALWGSAWTPFASYPEVTDVTPGSPAEKAGLKSGDLLVAMDGLSLKSLEGTKALRDVKPNQKVTLRVVRDGEFVTVSLTAGVKP